MTENNENASQAVSLEAEGRKGVDQQRLLTGSAALATAMLTAGGAGGQEMDKVDQAKRDKNITDPGPENPKYSRCKPEYFSAAGYRSRRSTNFLELILGCPPSHPGGRLVAVGYCRGFSDFQRYRGREHAPDGRRHPRTTLA